MPHAVVGSDAFSYSGGWLSPPNPWTGTAAVRPLEPLIGGASSTCTSTSTAQLAYPPPPSKGALKAAPGRHQQASVNKRNMTNKGMGACLGNNGTTVTTTAMCAYYRR